MRENYPDFLCMKCNAHICCLCFVTSNPGILQLDLLQIPRWADCPEASYSGIKSALSRELGQNNALKRICLKQHQEFQKEKRKKRMRLLPSRPLLCESDSAAALSPPPPEEHRLHPRDHDLDQGRPSRDPDLDRWIPPRRQYHDWRPPQVGCCPRGGDGNTAPARRRIQTTPFLLPRSSTLPTPSPDNHFWIRRFSKACLPPLSPERCLRDPLWRLHFFSSSCISGCFPG
jgi:hypothetical protein